MGFKFELKQAVSIAVSGEQGEVQGRAEYASGENNYYIRYRSHDGRATEAWWGESALVEAPVATEKPRRVVTRAADA